MEITITSTTKTVTLNGVPARIWEGRTASGIPVHCYVTRIAVANGLDTSQFEAELQSHEPPSAVLNEIPLRMIL